MDDWPYTIYIFLLPALEKNFYNQEINTNQKLFLNNISHTFPKVTGVSVFGVLYVFFRHERQTVISCDGSFVVDVING